MPWCCAGSLGTGGGHWLVPAVCFLQGSLCCIKAGAALILLLAACCDHGHGLMRGCRPVLSFWHWLSWLWQSSGKWLMPGANISFLMLGLNKDKCGFGALGAFLL